MANSCTKKKNALFCQLRYFNHKASELNINNNGIKNTFPVKIYCINYKNFLNFFLINKTIIEHTNPLILFKDIN